MSWNVNEEKLLCLMLLDDNLAPLMSSDAGPAYFRAFIVENRKTGEVALKLRFRYKRGPRMWTKFAHKELRGAEAMKEFHAGVVNMLTYAAQGIGRELPASAIKSFYPPDDQGDAGKTIIWLEMQDLIEIESVVPIPPS